MTALRLLFIPEANTGQPETGINGYGDKGVGGDACTVPLLTEHQFERTVAEVVGGGTPYSEAEVVCPGGQGVHVEHQGSRCVPSVSGCADERSIVRRSAASGQQQAEDEELQGTHRHLCG